MKKILYLSCYDQPQGASLRTFNYARSFADKGHKVTMVCNNYSHLTKKFASKKNFIKKNGVDIFFIKNKFYKDQGISRIYDMLINFFGILRLFLFRKFDLIIAPSVPLPTALAGLILFFFNKNFFFFEIRDVWPDCLVYNKTITKMNPIFWIFKIIEILCYKFSTCVITTLPKAFKHVRKYNSKVPIYYVPNSVDINLKIKFNNYKKNKLNIVYVGRFNDANDTMLIVNCANLLKNNPKIHFNLYGDGFNKEKNVAISKKFNLKNITFHSHIKKSIVTKVLSNANILIAPIIDSKALQWGINSNKIYEYMNAARPIVFAGNVSNNIVSKSQGNFTAKAGDYKRISKHIIFLSKLSKKKQHQIGIKNHFYLKKHFNLSRLSIFYMSIFEKLKTKKL